ncbi:MAG: prenyltransferase/squalene oxidase repeat-containing protein [Planctomycetota bacterium]
MSRRLFAFALACLIGLTPAARGKDSPRARSTGDRQRQAAIRGGLRFLASQQQRDGSWGSKARVGVTSIGVLAFLARGHQIGRGPYGGVIERGARYLLSCSLAPSASNPRRSTVPGKPSGYIWGGQADTNSRMHGHGYATQVLCLVYGSGVRSAALRTELRRAIKRAVRVIEEAQTFTGGWGYAPSHSTQHEGSITVTVVQALRLARDAGFIVDMEVYKRGLKYLKESQKPDGSFRYSLNRSDSTAALTAAALCAMHGFAEYRTHTTRAALGFLRDRHGTVRRLSWPFYGRYYAAQVYYRTGGADWKRWNRDWVPRILIEAERTDEGYVYWDDAYRGRDRSHGKAYATALSCLTLSIGDGLLPLFEK